MTDQAAQLSALVDTWWEAVNDFTALLERLPEEAWSAETDLPGWDVHAIAAHTAHLEALLAGAEHDDVEIGDAPHAKGMMGQFTEQGVVARRDRTPDELINEIRESTTTRHTDLLANPPTDPDAPAPGLFGAIGWTTRTLLRNRPLDIALHEQDVRRAIGEPGGIDSAASAHSAAYLAESLGFVLAKKVQAPAGTTVRLEVEGHAPITAAVDENGKGRLVEESADEPTVGIRTDRETFLVLAGGRRAAESGRVEIFGDTELGQKIVANFGVTP